MHAQTFPTGTALADLSVGPFAFNQEHRDIAKQAVVDAGLWDTCAGVVISGSLADGLGHAESDIDVYVYVDEISEQRVQERSHAIRVDVEQILVKDILSLTAPYASFTDAGTDRRQVRISDADLKLLVRTHLGHVLKNSSVVQRARSHISHLTLRRVIMARAMRHAASYAEDAAGTLAIDDVLTAHNAATIALDLACDAALAACGDVYVSDKLRLRRMAREPRLADFVERYWSTQYLNVPRTADKDAFRDSVHRKLWLVNAVGAVCVLDFWDSEPTAPIQLAEVRNPAGVTRSPFAVPMRNADGCGLFVPNAGFDLSVDALRVWAFLDGSPVEEMAQRYVRDRGASHATAADFTSAVAQLVAAGLASSASD